MGEGRGVYRVLVGRPEGERPLRSPRCRDRWCELDSAGSGDRPMMGFYEHGNEPSGSTKKAGNF
jgi:hypothetical protein